MKNELFISIIIPVYNVEKYLCECVESILTQSFKNYEIILVNDGSTDGCPVICDEYAAVHENIKVIHKKNGGLSDARNSGIFAATGKYLLFVDSDDFIAEDSLCKIYEAVSGSGDKDMFFLNAVCIFPDGKTTPYGTHFTTATFQNKSKDDVLIELAGMPQFHVSACIKLVRREFFIDNFLFFTKGLLCEDVDWSIKMYLCTKSIGFCEHIHYFYRQEREGSIMFVFSEKRYTDILFIINKWLEKAKTDYKIYEKIIYLFMSHQYHVLVCLYSERNNINRVKYKSELKKLSWLLKASGSSKAKILFIFYKVFGIKILSMTLNFLFGT